MPHVEAYSIAELFSRKVLDNRYQPTVHFVYHPCLDAIDSMRDAMAQGWVNINHKRLLGDDILEGKDELGILVVRKHFPDGPCTFCGKVKELTVGRIEWFQVETMLGEGWFDGRNTRLCSGDGRCSCEAEPANEALLEVAIPTEIAIGRLMRNIGGGGHD